MNVETNEKRAPFSCERCKEGRWTKKRLAKVEIHGKRVPFLLRELIDKGRGTVPLPELLAAVFAAADTRGVLIIQHSLQGLLLQALHPGKVLLQTVTRAL